MNNRDLLYTTIRENVIYDPYRRWNLLRKPFALVVQQIEIRSGVSLTNRNGKVSIIIDPGSKLWKPLRNAVKLLSAEDVQNCFRMIQYLKNGKTTIPAPRL